MKRFFLTLAVAAAMFTGCAIQTPVPTAPVVEVIETTEYMESTARVLEPKQKMLLTTLIADLKVSEQKVYYTETETNKIRQINEWYFKGEEPVEQTPEENNGQNEGEQ